MQGILGCLLGFWPLGQNPAGAIKAYDQLFNSPVSVISLYCGSATVDVILLPHYCQPSVDACNSKYLHIRTLIFRIQAVHVLISRVFSEKLA